MSCENAGNTPPEYRITSGEFIVEFKSLKPMEIDDPTQTHEECTQTTQDTTQAQKITTQAQEITTQDTIAMQILDIIREDCTLSQPQIAKKIGRSTDYVKFYMKKLRSKGVIKREGNNQKGKWVILPPYDKTGD